MIRREAQMAGAPLVVLSLLALMQTGCMTTPRPDLSLGTLTLNADNYLKVSIRNDGDGPVPSPGGALTIYVDGSLAAQYSFDTWPADMDKSFVSPGRTSVITTNVRLSGGGPRHLTAIIDSNNEIDERNEFQNSITKTETPTVVPGVDYAVTALARSTTTGTLSFLVRNGGTAASPASRRVMASFSIDGARSGQYVTLPALAPGASAWVIPGTALSVPYNAQVVVTLQTTADQDVDRSNNWFKDYLPNGPQMAAINALLSDTRISSALVWNEWGTRMTHDRWPTAIKAQFKAVLANLYRGRSIAVAPTSAANARTITHDSALALYLANVATSLWVEAEHYVPWSLTTLPADQRALILDSDRFTIYVPGLQAYASLIGDAIPDDPAALFQFMMFQRKVKGDHRRTIYALTEWFVGHLYHGSDGYYGHSGSPRVSSILWPPPHKKHMSTGGCWTTGGVFNAMLRTVNIPVKLERTHFNEGEVHASPSFPSVRLLLPHGDDVYSAQVNTGYSTMLGGTLPVSNLFFTSDGYSRLFVTPRVACSTSGCNSTAQQNSVNHSRHRYNSGLLFFSDNLFKIFLGSHGRSTLYRYLVGDDHGEPPPPAPAYGPERANAILDSLQGTISDALGEGDASRGAALLQFQLNVWGDNSNPHMEDRTR